MLADPGSAPLLFDAGLEAFRRGAPGGAETWLARSVAAAPWEPKAQFALAVVASSNPIAVSSLKRALALDPCYAQAWLEAAARNRVPAGISVRRARAAVDDNVDAATNLAAVLLDERNLPAARRLTDRLCRQWPQHAPVWVNRGRVAVEDGSWPLGLTCMRRAVALAPDMFEAWMNLGAIAGECLLVAAAAAAANRAVAINPRHAQARWNRTLSLLAKGDWRRGFADFDVRLELQTAYPHALSGRRWRGERFAGRLLIHDEIGYGDVLNFLRYVPLARERVASLTLEVKPGLYRLVTGYPGIDWLIQRGERPPAPETYDAFVPLESLPGLFGTTAASIPSPQPTLKPPDELVEAWAERLAGVRRPRIGLCWAGNPMSAFDGNRSCRLDDLRPLLELDCVSFVSLQKGPAVSQRHDNLIEPGAELADFADTAAVIANLDLVISVETAVCHLAGAMGRPLWILLSANPAWRWPRTGDRTLWYPPALLMRLRAGEQWVDLARRVASRLRERFG